MDNHKIYISINEGVKERGFVKGWSTMGKRTASQPFRIGSVRSMTEALKTIVNYLSQGEPVYIEIGSDE